MRFATIVLCGVALGLMGVSASPSLAQSTGPAADKVDTSPPDTGTINTQASPPAPPETALPAAAPPEQTPSEPPPSPSPQAEVQAQKPAETSGPVGNVETVGPGQAVSILGKKVVGQDGKTILGAVIDLLVDGDGKPRAAVIDFGGFLGVGSRHVAIDWNSLKFHLDDQAAPVQLDLDPAAIKSAPEYKEVDANAEVVEPALSLPAPLPVVAPLSELPIENSALPSPPAGTHSAKNAGQ